MKVLFNGIFLFWLILGVQKSEAVEVSYKHPENGRECVTHKGSERAGGRTVYIKFENICNRYFSVRIEPSTGHGVRGTGIGPGSPSSPEKMHIAFGENDGCDSGKWYYD